MSIRNYLRPQLSIRQLLDTTPTAVANRLNALVVGPNYHVEPYTESPVVAGVPYLSAGRTVAFPNADTGETLDAASVRIFAKALQLARVNGTGTIPSLAEAHVVKLTGTTVAAQGLQVGDLFISDHLTNDGFSRKITGFRGSDVASSYVQDAESSANPTTNGTLTVTPTPTNDNFLPAKGTGSWAGLANGATYAGKYGDLFTVTCTTAGAPGTAVVSIRSNSGLYDADSVPTTDSSGKYAIAGTYFEGVQITITKQGANRDLQIGDVIAFQVLAPYALLSTSVLAASDAGSGYTGNTDTTYLIKVTTGGAMGVAQVQVSDTAGIDVVQAYTPTNGGAFNVGTKGIRATFTGADASLQGGLRKGDVYVIVATAATQSTSTFDKVILDGPAIDITGLSADAATTWVNRGEYTGEVIPTETNTGTKTWTASTVSGGVVFAASAKVRVTRDSGVAYLSIVDNTGELFASYRALTPPAAGEGLLSFTTSADVDTVLGTGDMDNVLAYGVKRALSGAQGRTVYALRTGGTDAAAFNVALNKVRHTDSVYSICTLSDLLAVKQALGQHCDAMSAEAVKNFRRGYVGTDTTGAYGSMVKKSNGTNNTATVGTLNGANLKVYAASGGFVTANIGAGDLFRTNYAVDSWGAETYEEYVVESRISDTELSLVSGPGSAINPAARFEVWKADTAANQQSYVSEVSSAIGSRRVANVWCDRGSSVGIVVPAMFIAAEVAGLRSALYPQQGLTRTEVTTITSAANMYLKYSAEELDAIAAAGTFIVTQDADGGPVYIRHQLTTKTDSGSLYYEDSVGTNLDSISFGFKDILDRYIGRRNANPETVAEVTQKVSLFLDLQTASVPTSDIGPALISYDGLTIAVDDNFKDRINISATAVMPLPLNNIAVTLRGSTS
jgi:hypothetical protein